MVWHEEFEQWVLEMKRLGKGEWREATETRITLHCSLLRLEAGCLLTVFHPRAGQFLQGSGRRLRKCLLQTLWAVRGAGCPRALAPGVASQGS